MESVILIGLYNLLVLCQEWCVQALFAQDEEAGWERDPDYVPILSSIWKMCSWLWCLRDFQISVKMNLSSSLVISWWVNYSKFFPPSLGVGLDFVETVIHFHLKFTCTFTYIPLNSSLHRTRLTYIWYLLTTTCSQSHCTCSLRVNETH